MALTAEEQQALSGLLSGGVGALGTLAAAQYGAGQQNQLAGQLLAQGQQAAQAAQFRPVGVTSRFGTSGFTYDNQGRLTGAGYQVAPDVAAMRERLMGQAGTNLEQATQAAGQIAPVGAAAQSLFNLGQGYLAQTPQAAAQNWMQQQQALLQPSREQQLAQLTNQQFQRGRLGLGVGATSGTGGVAMGASNPQMQAYYNALAQQDAQLAAQAMQQGQEQTKFGAGLFGTGAQLLGQVPAYQVAALSPYEKYLAGASTAEALGQNPLDIASALGARQSTAGAQVSQILNSAAQQAAARQQAGMNLQQQALTGGIAGLTDPVSKLIGSLTGLPTSGGVSAITNPAQAGKEGFGWQYFSDGTAIDPSGNYYYNNQLTWSPGWSTTDGFDYTGINNITWE
jgi:hypothetical protein